MDEWYFVFTFITLDAVVDSFTFSSLSLVNLLFSLLSYFVISRERGEEGGILTLHHVITTPGFWAGFLL